MTRAASLIAAADPSQLLPAREQMAFTLGFHIILVPFGVAFTFITMIANYRALRRGDADALLLAQRWSKVAAVLFAVGAVSGTVLSFEMGLLWPGLMGRFGAAYGIPFAVEGIFFFLEAIFVAIYIYGWNRLPPWVHFWTGLPVVLVRDRRHVLGRRREQLDEHTRAASRCGAGGSSTSTSGRSSSTMRSGTRRSTCCSPPTSWPGFTVAGVYAVGMLRGRRDRYHRLGLLVPLTVGAIAIPLQIVMGDFIARYVFENEPAKFAAIEALPHTRTHAPEVLGGILVDGKVRFGLPHARRRLAAVRLQPVHPGPRPRRDPGRGASAGPPGHDRAPVLRRHGRHRLRARRAGAVVRPVVVAQPRAATPNRWFLRATAVSGVVSIVSLECGWIVTEVGPPAVDRRRAAAHPRRVQTAGQPLAAVRRRAGHLCRGHDRRGLRPARAAPALGAGSRTPRRRTVPRTNRSGVTHDHRRRRRPARRRSSCYGVFGGADFGTGLWDLTAGGAASRRAPARAHRPRHRAGLGGQPHLADLLSRRALVRVPDCVRRRS